MYFSSHLLWANISRYKQDISNYSSWKSDIHTCQRPGYKNLETSRNLCIVRMSFSTMSEYSPKITQRPSACSQHLSVRTAFIFHILFWNAFIWHTFLWQWIFFVNNNATIIDLFHVGVMVSHFKSRGMLVQILLCIFLFSPLTDRYMETKKCCVHVINDTRFEKEKHHPRTKKVYQTKQFKLIITNGPCSRAS